MKRISWILTVPLIIVAVVFLTSNREPVTLDFYPFELSAQISLRWVLLACVGFGLVVGGLATWLSAGPTRRRARQARRRVAELEQEAVRLRQERDRAPSAAPAAADSGQTGLPSPAAAAPESERRSALGR